MIKAPSAYVVGPANYNVSRTQKANRVFEKKANDFAEFERRLDSKINQLAKAKDRAEFSALSKSDQLKKNIASAEREIARMNPTRDEFFIKNMTKQKLSLEKKLTKLQESESQTRSQLKAEWDTAQPAPTQPLVPTGVKGKISGLPTAIPKELASLEQKTRKFETAKEFIRTRELDPDSIYIKDNKNLIVENSSGNDALLKDIPIEAFGKPKFETLNQYKYKTGRKITDPIEATLENGELTITDGANRFTQAMANGDRTIPTIIEARVGDKTIKGQGIGRAVEAGLSQNLAAKVKATTPKSQLTDFYNQAVKQPASKPLALTDTNLFKQVEKVKKDVITTDLPVRQTGAEKTQTIEEYISQKEISTAIDRITDSEKIDIDYEAIPFEVLKEVEDIKKTTQKTLFDAIKKNGGIKSFKKGFLKEELAEVPLRIRNNKTGLTADEMADALSEQGFQFESDNELIDAIAKIETFARSKKEITKTSAVKLKSKGITTKTAKPFKIPFKVYGKKGIDNQGILTGLGVEG